MGRFALVKGTEVINIVEWEGEETDFGEGVTPVEIPDGNGASPGWTYEDGEFIAPPLTEDQQEAITQAAINSNINMRTGLMSQATAAIAPLQDAVDLEEATEDEIALLKKWKQYRIAVNRIDANTPDDIDWPEQPA